MSPLHTLSPADRFAIEDLLTRYGWLIDHGRGVECAELFTDDGRLAFLGETLVGRDAIGQALAERSSGKQLIVRHSWTSLHITRVSKGRVSLQTIAITYLATPATPSQKRVMVGDTEDELIRVAPGQWLFASRRLDDVMPFESS